MVRAIDYIALLLLGILIVLAFTHLINGTFTQWVGAKFGTKPNA